MSTIERFFLPLLSTMMRDPVPNVRINVAKTLKLIAEEKREDLDFLVDVKPLLLQLYADLDGDVKYYSYIALKEINM